MLMLVCLPGRSRYLQRCAKKNMPVVNDLSEHSVIYGIHLLYSPYGEGAIIGP